MHPVDQMTTMLRNAQPSLQEKAARDLLIAEGTWLRRGDFTRTCIHVLPAEELLDPARPVALIDWEKVRTLVADPPPCSRSELSVLEVALSLAAGHPVDLGQCLPRLDRTNSCLVIEALERAAQLN